MDQTMRWKGLICSAACLALLLSWPSGASARKGFYLGVGAAQTLVGGDLDGTHSFVDPSGSPAFIAGKMDSGSGIAAAIGYGLNRFFGVEYLYEDTQHKATSSLTAATSNAEFTIQVYGIRLTAPFSERFEGFVRSGYGMYDANYNSYSSFGPGLTQRGKVSFTGTGTAVGAGFELFFKELGIEFGYTQHTFTMDRAKPTGGQKLGLSSNLSGTASTIDVMFNFHF